MHADEIEAEGRSGPFVGTVVSFNGGRGYGFIALDDPVPTNDTDLIVHHSAIRMEGFRILRPGQRVSCKIAPGPAGSGMFRAMHVVPLDETPR